MTAYLKHLILLAAISVVSQKFLAQDSSFILHDKFDNIIERWYSSASNGDSGNFQSLLTDNFQLLAFGKRFDKNEIVEMSKAYSGIHYTLNKINFSESGNIGYITFDINLKCILNSKPTEGHAMEAYLLQKINGAWKVATKVIVMKEEGN